MYLPYLHCCGLAVASSLALFASAQQPAIELLATHRVAGTALDRSDLSGTLETEGPSNAFGGWSAIDYDAAREEYLLLSDRGPGDGAASFACRFHRVSLSLQERKEAVDSKTKYSIDFHLRSTQLFSYGNGVSYTGSLSALHRWDGSGECPSLDPEGIRIVGDTLFVSDEYGPSVRSFRLDGRLRSHIPLPNHVSLVETQKPRTSFGAFSNRGIEGLCITSDGSKLVGAFQGPLIQDGRLENNKCLGIKTRWIVIDPQSASVKEFVYQLDDETTGVSEILALDSDQFLVLERDSLMGAEARIKRIYLTSWVGATDVHSQQQLREQTASELRPVKKRLLIDLQSPEFGISGSATPEKPEGLTWGPNLTDGRKVLWVCFDNDFEPQVDSIVMAFAIDASKLTAE
jgi:hypothetical protein